MQRNDAYETWTKILIKYLDFSSKCGDMAESHKKFIKGFCMGGETPFGSDPKGDYKLELHSPLEPHKEEEYRATPLGCEP